MNFHDADNSHDIRATYKDLVSPAACEHDKP